MRLQLKALGGMAVAVCFVLAMAGAAQAVPFSSAPSNLRALEGSLATQVHCRVYYHCHRRCWWRRGHRHCRRFCHFCG